MCCWRWSSSARERGSSWSGARHAACGAGGIDPATSTWLVITARSAAHLDEVERWARNAWLVTVETDPRLGPVADQLRAWADACRHDPTGLDRLTQLTR